ncbi:MAG TPA: dihydrodipicolinate synthase family protein [Terriglobales bacterium]|jgi:dihydrodipicolinate synthase/N-acetylneuraminate lyase
MRRDERREKLTGCYVTVPTIFRDETLDLDLDATGRNVRFLLNQGIRTGTGVLLAGGAAGDFSTMTIEERLAVGKRVIEEAAGRVPVALGAQTTSTRELVQLARGAESIGAEYIQISPPFYFAHTQEDFFEYAVTASEAADVGIIVYNTFWTSIDVSFPTMERVCELKNVVGLKWSVRDTGFMEFEQGVQRFASKVSVIDNQLRFVTSHMIGARAIEVHVCNYWPEWGVRLWEMLERRRYEEAQHQIVRVAMPFYVLWAEMEKYTGGDGYLDKLCMEIVGLDSGRCRPPTRDVRHIFMERARDMLDRCGVLSARPARMAKG